MRYLDQSWTRIFLAPDDGTGGGGGSASANPGQQQQQQQAAGTGSSSTFVDPTAGIDLDDLDPEVRKVVEASRTGFATLQKQAADAETARAHEERRRTDFQSQFDRLKNQVGGLANGNGGAATDDPKVQQLERMTAILLKKGVTPQNAAIQAELMLDMMSDYGATLKAEIGKDLRPFATTIVSREAEFAWNGALQSDNTGAMAIPEVAQVAWTQVQTMVEQGQQVTPGVVQNLVGMAYFAHLQKGGIASTPNQQQQQSVSNPPNLPNVGRLTYPGAGGAPSRPPTNDPRAAKTHLDPDTDAALQTVMKQWANGQGGVKAPGYREPAKKGAR